MYSSHVSDARGFVFCVSAQALFCLCTWSMCSYTTAAPPGWDVVWQDEFNGSSVDTDKWEPIFWTTPFNNEQQAYLPQQVTVSDGNLVLTAEDSPFGGKQYRSGKVESKLAQQFGRWEVRAKLPGTLGTWPAIWLLPSTEQWGWPTQGEIDILENRGNQPHLTSSAYHWGSSVATHQFTFQEQQTTIHGQPANYHKEFHTYAVEWESNQLRFYVDDVHHFTIHDDNVGNFISNQTAPMELNINVAVGGDFLGGAQPGPGSEWPQQMLIDYVRVYERGENPSPAVFRNGDFEEQGGSLAGWSTFGNQQPNVQVSNEAVSEGTSAAKLFGQFTGGTNYSGFQQGISVSAGDSLAASANVFVDSADSIFGTDNMVEMKFDYFSVFGGEFGSDDYLGSESIVIADGNTQEDQWNEHVLTRTAPANAVEARLSFVFGQVSNASGAVYIDEVSFANLDLALNADSDSDGDVDGTDFLNWQRGFGANDATSVAVGDFDFNGFVDGLDLETWEAQFGAGALLQTSSLAVPEPSVWSMSILSLALRVLAGARTAP